MTLGVIDVGTNSAHLLVARLGPRGRVRVTRHEHALVQLGQGAVARGRLTPQACRRTMRVLSRYAATLAREQVARVEAVATSAVREASNGRAFVRRVRQRTRLPLRVISGREEARLIYLGMRALQRSRPPALILTIGGGSAQAMCGAGRGLRYAASVRLGGGRLAQQFIHHDPPRAEELRRLNRHVRRVWSPVVRKLRRRRWRQALTGSATVDQVMMAAHLLRHPTVPQPARPPALTQQSLRGLIAWLSSSTARARRRLRGLDPRREAQALPTAMALLAWMEGCQVPRLRHASGSLREGLVADAAIRYHAMRRGSEGGDHGTAH